MLGTTNVTTNASGTAQFARTLTGAASQGVWFTATATSPAGDTSVFSAPVMTPTHQSGSVTWEFGGASAQRITDSTGLGLFDSGNQAPGTSFVHEFDAAGAYPWADAPGGWSPITGVVEVPIQVTAGAGTATIRCF